MSADPLAQFRRTPAGTAGPATPAKGQDGYLAFGTKDKNGRLRIRRAMAPTHSPSYSSLWNVTYDGQFGTNFVLYYGFLSVNVRGKNLQALIFAIEGGMADFIQEFDPERWEKPKDDAAAFIESIEVIVSENAHSSDEKAGTMTH